jgi:hypothetical protein
MALIFSGDGMDFCCVRRAPRSACRVPPVVCFTDLGEEWIDDDLDEQDLAKHPEHQRRPSQQEKL